MSEVKVVAAILVDETLSDSERVREARRYCESALAALARRAGTMETIHEDVASPAAPTPAAAPVAVPVSEETLRKLVVQTMRNEVRAVRGNWSRSSLVRVCCCLPICLTRTADLAARGMCILLGNVIVVGALASTVIVGGYLYRLVFTGGPVSSIF